jgi:hypothetical protein
VRRKELERRASGGVFVWGIGNGLGNGIRDLVNAQPQPRVLFSPIRSAAAEIDRKPAGVLLWLDVLGPNGPQPLPRAAWVTSRSSTAKGATKAHHYALFCHSADELEPGDFGAIQFAELRNMATLRPVGFSQVTAVVSRSGELSGRELEYRVVLSAQLAAPFFGRLANPVELSSEDSERIDAIAELGDAELWTNEVDALKARHRNSLMQCHVALPFFEATMA